MPIPDELAPGAPIEGVPLPVGPGPRIAGRFTRRELLGHGPHGVVYLARDESSGTDLALKLLPVPAASPRFTRLAGLVDGGEARPCSLAVRALGEEGAFSFIAMDLAPGPSLEHLLVKEGSLELDAAKDLVRKIAEALARLHATGAVHGNLKPANVFVCGDEVVLSDALEVLRSTRHGASVEGGLVGVHAFLPPEALAFEALTPASDVFSLAALAVFLTTGMHPFASTDAVGFASQVLGGRVSPAVTRASRKIDDGLRGLLAQSLSARRDDRPADAGEFLELFETGRSRRARRVRVGRAAAVGALAVALGVGTAYGVRAVGHSATSDLLAPGARMESRGEARKALELDLLLLEDEGLDARSRKRLEESAERLLETVAGRGDDVSARKAAERVASWKGDDAAFRKRYASLLVPEGAVPPQGTPPPSRPPRERSIEQLLDAGDLEGAQKLLDAAQAAPPPDPGEAQRLEGLRARLRIEQGNGLRRDGNLALATGDYGTAKARFEALLRLDPGDAVAEARLREVSSVLAASTPLASLSPAVPAPGALGTGASATPPGAATPSAPPEPGDAVADAVALVERKDFVGAADRLGQALDRGRSLDGVLAGRVFFNASVLSARAGDCERARHWAERAARYDDPDRKLSNAGWLKSLDGASDCKDGRFQAYVEGLALK